mmetsp:Transcript_65264/g.95579  ORF Transcript_65264/g.95579 Transcript_65264/m.95579 type:complete len:88 (-) Transcript_65264:461-724(-)
MQSPRVEIWIKIITITRISNCVLIPISDFLIEWDQETTSEVLMVVLNLINSSFMRAKEDPEVRAHVCIYMHTHTHTPTNTHIYTHTY